MMMMLLLLLLLLLSGQGLLSLLAESWNYTHIAPYLALLHRLQGLNSGLHTYFCKYFPDCTIPSTRYLLF